MASPIQKLLTGASVAFGISYAVQQLLLTRLFSPTEMGFADAFFAMVMPCSILVSGRLEDAFALTKSDKEAHNLQTATLLLAILGSICCGFAMLFSPFTKYAFLFSITIFFTALTRFAESIWSMQQAFSPINNSRIAQSLLTSLGQSIAGFTIGGGLGLILAQSVARILSAGFYVSILKKLSNHKIEKTSDLRNSIKFFSRFPLFSMPAALLNSISNNLAFLILPLFYDWAMVGQFGRAYKLLLLPLSLLMTAYGQVFYAQAPEAFATGRLSAKSLEMLKKLALFCGIPCLICIIWGHQLVPFILGEDWKTAGIYLQWIAPWLFFHALASPLTRIFDLTNTQKYDFAFSLFMLIIQAATLFFVASFGDAFLTLKTFCITGILLRMLQIGILLRFASIKH